MRAILKQFEYALVQEDVTQAKVILTYHKQKINLDYKDECGRTLLHKGCLQGSLPVVRLLVEQGASLQITDPDGNTALHLVCINEHYQLTRFLLNNCADVYARNHEGKQPIDVTPNSNIRFLVQTEMTLTSHENKVMTLGRIKKKKQPHQQQEQQQQNPRLAYNETADQNSRTRDEKHGYTTLRSMYDDKRNAQPDDYKSTHKLPPTRKMPIFSKGRRGSLNICSKVKKMNSFNTDSPKTQVRRFNEKKWTELQALRRVSSEADIGRLTDDSMVDKFGGKMQKVDNTEELNLVGLTN